MRTTDTMKVHDIPIDSIDVGEQMIRQHTTGEGLQDLILDIAQHGLLQPIGVFPKEGGRYQLLYGYRRLTACRSLRWPTIPAVIHDAVDGSDVKFIAMRENIQRAQMSFTEEAETVRIMYEERGYSINMIAESLGKSTGWVQKRLAFFSMPPDVAEAFRDDRIPYSVAEILSTIEDDPTRAQVLFQAIAGQWTAAQTRQVVDVIKTTPSITEAVEAGLRAAEEVRTARHLVQCDLCDDPAPLTSIQIVRLCPACAAGRFDELKQAFKQVEEQIDAND